MCEPVRLNLVQSLSEVASVTTPLPFCGKGASKEHPSGIHVNLQLGYLLLKVQTNQKKGGKGTQKSNPLWKMAIFIYCLYFFLLKIYALKNFSPRASASIGYPHHTTDSWVGNVSWSSMEG